jgi:hypothetical protein
MKSRSMLPAAAALIAGLAVGVPQPALPQAAEAPDLNGFWTHGFSLGFDPPPKADRDRFTTSRPRRR